MSFHEWQKQYHEKEIINLKKELTVDDFEIIEKLEIEIKDKIYTEYEFEYLKLALYKYYKGGDMNKEEMKAAKKLTNGVTRKKYNELLNKIEEIDKNYQEIFSRIEF